MNPQVSNAGENSWFCIICYGDCAKCSEEEKELVPKFFKELGLYCYSQNQLRKLCSLDKETVDGMIELGILGTCKTCLNEMKEYCGLFAVGRGRRGDLTALNGKVSIIQNKLEVGYKMHDTLEGVTGVLHAKPELWDMFQKIKSFKERLIEKCSRKVERFESKLSLPNRPVVVAGTQTKKKFGGISRLPSKPNKKTGQDGGTSSLQSGKSLPLRLVGNQEKTGSVWKSKNYKKTENGRVMCNDCGRIYKNGKSYGWHLYKKRCTKDLGQKSDSHGIGSQIGFPVEAKKARAAHARERQEAPTPKQSSEDKPEILSERDEELLKKPGVHTIRRDILLIRPYVRHVQDFAFNPEPTGSLVCDGVN